MEDSMNGIIFWENGDVQMIGQLTTVRLIAMKVQQVIPDLVQQERNAILDTMTEQETRRAVELYGQKQKEKDMSDA